ncbi:MAG: DUF1559 domain-containing protein [Lacipirellulaceae bacterium]
MTPHGRPSRGGVTLVELLVVIGIIGALVALLLPAVQSARESARRATCVNRMRQLVLAAQNHVAARGVLPAGAVARGSMTAPGTPWTFYRWSALATLTPYLENTAIRDALDFDEPLYGANFSVTPVNAPAVRQVVADFLCPSDSEARLREAFGPTNYAVCAGSGEGDPAVANDDGSPLVTDGPFAVNSGTRPGHVTDGLSKTALASESTLGQPRDGSPHDPQFEYRFITTSPLRNTPCEQSQSWNQTDPRGFSWANGEFRCALYNHHDPPNAAEADCMGVRLGGGLEALFTPFGWRAARSLHPGGVNLALCDGSVRFAEDGVSAEVWRALATIAGEEPRQ